MDVDAFIETCSSDVTCEIQNFKDALVVWLIKPHVLNRRLAGSVTIFDKTYDNNFKRTDMENTFSEILLFLKYGNFDPSWETTIKNHRDIADHFLPIEDDTSDRGHTTVQVNDNNVSTPLHKIELPLPDNFFQRAVQILLNVLNEHTTDESILEVNFFFRKLLAKNIERHFGTYELVITITAASHITSLFLPLTMENDVAPLFHRCHYVNFESRNSSLKHFIFKEFENDAPSASLVATRNWLVTNLVNKLKTWSEASFLSSSPLRKSQSLELIDIERYTKLYTELKKKYGDYFIKIWTESTDPLKYVYEDIAIATYLLLLWSGERSRDNAEKKQSFVDLGCGNGLLVHLLSAEGHPGRGIDISKRKIWDLYGENTILQEDTISPDSLVVTEDYIIGNHSDELTPWIPVIAARSSANTKYFVLPCCFHDFYGKFRRIKQNKPQYEMYLEYVRSLGEKCGFKVEQDVMRIPSTKRICQVGRSRTDLLPNLLSVIHESTNSMAQNHFTPREVSNDPKNCSRVDNQVKERIVNLVIQKLLSDGHGDVLVESKEKGETSVGVPCSQWNKGGSAHLNKLISLIDQGTLKELKSQCGGFQTLLKNHRHIFKVIGGLVSLRDYRNPEDTLPSYKTQIKIKTGECGKDERFKTKLCWFHSNHPHGCVLNSKCHFAHGIDELRALCTSC